MTKLINVDAFLRHLGEDQTGISRPIIVIGEDGNTYILKNQNVFNSKINRWVTFDCMFLQELLVYQIAKYLDIDTPDCAILNVDEQLLNANPELRFENRYTPGIHFGSKLIDNVENNIVENYEKMMRLGKPYIKKSWNAFFKKIHNPENIPKVIALDFLTGNFDRFNNVGNLIVANINKKRKIFAIDHGHCFFGPTWDTKKQKLMQHVTQVNHQQYINEIVAQYFQITIDIKKPFSGLGIIFRAIDQHIDVSDPEDHSFIDVVSKIESISPSTIDLWFDIIPDEWYVDKRVQKSHYKQFILRQKDIVRGIINELARGSAFSSHTGGELKWKERKTGTQ